MGYRPIRTLSDAAKHGFFVEVTCPGCGRRGVFDPNGASQRGDPTLERFAARLVCRGEAGRADGCGHKGAVARFISWPPTPPRQPAPKPLSSPAPKGIDQDEWDRSDDRDRKRLIARARG